MKSCIIHIVSHQHFDLVWRRDLAWYRERRKQLFEQIFTMLRRYPQFTFTFCQTWPLRELVTAMPELKNELAGWLRQGRVEIVGGEETIADLNLVSPLALDRNLTMGREWLRRELDYEVTGAAWEDAFGVSAQVPQLLVRHGYRFYKAGRMPRPGQDDLSGDFVWEGLDGTTIRCIAPKPEHGVWGWGHSDNPDDPPVKDLALRGQRLRNQLEAAARNPEKKAILFVAMGEEHDLYLPFCELVEELNQTHPETEFRFSTYRNYFASLPEAYWRTVPRIGRDVDLSRVLTGCYTSRNDSKRQPRRLEHRLWAASAGGAAIDPASWRALFLLQFHDAIGGCHIDENADRLKECYRQAMASTTGIRAVIPWTRRLPVWPQFAAAASTVPEAGEGSCGDWRLTWSDGKLRNIGYRDRNLGALSDLLVREEHGTLWTEEYSGRQHRLPTAADPIEELQMTADGIRIVTGGCWDRFKSMWPGFSRLTYRRTVTLTAVSPLALVEYELDWLGSATEISVGWQPQGPVLTECRAEIPFGSVRRTGYEPQLMQGDVFPALNWVKTTAYSLFNQGTPAHALRDGKLETVLLRSPVKRWSPWFPVTPTENTWDNGKRRYCFLYDAELNPALAELSRIGMEFNVAATTETEYGNPPELDGLPDNVVVAGWRPTADGCREALLFEAEGRPAHGVRSGATHPIRDFSPWELRKEIFHG